MENKLTVDRAKAIEAYQLATPDQQRVLESIFGREAFAPSWQDDLKRACNDLGINAGDAFPFIHSAFDTKEAEVLNAYAALRILAKWVTVEGAVGVMQRKNMTDGNAKEE